jgi:Flp pilus assembly protein TadD
VEPKLGLTLPLLAQKRWRDLERACRDVLAVDAPNATARARLAHALYALGNYPDSAAAYRKLIADYPSVLDHQTGLGWALLRMGRRAEAHRLFQGVLAVSPDNANARAGLAAP